jgi:hypothetical protein
MSRIFFNIKVCGKEEHRDGFLDGNLFMNPLGFFRQYEEDEAANIGDRHEATVTLLQPGQFTMTINDYTIPAEDFAEASVIQYNGYNTLNLLCLYAVHERGHSFGSEENFESFVEAQMLKPEVDGLGDYAAVVVNTKAFQERVFQAIRREGFKAMASLVDYYDPTTFNGTFDADRAVFNKRDTYSHQREYRVALDRGVEGETPYSLEVGSLRDICVGCHTSEVNELIRTYLYQMKAQGVFNTSAEKLITK